MFNKQLTKKIELTTEENASEKNGAFELEYYLIESYAADLDELTGKTVYGIEIIKKVNESNIETQTVTNLSCFKENAEMILNKLASNTVTPVGLPFVLDDLLGV